jgi:hypothetical protein
LNTVISGGEKCDLLEKDLQTLLAPAVIGYYLIHYPIRSSNTEFFASEWLFYAFGGSVQSSNDRFGIRSKSTVLRVNKVIRLAIAIDAIRDALGC